MQQSYEADHHLYPTTYPTVFRDVEPKMEHAPSQTAPVLPFPMVDYFGECLLAVSALGASLLVSS
jgi:hypothetical protein